MKAIFITSLVSAVMSLVAIIGLSAMEVAPGAGAEIWCMILVASAFLVGWLCLAFWMRPRQRPVLPPRWLKGMVVFVGIVYVVGTLLFVLG
jgi:hypothetical protein